MADLIIRFAKLDRLEELVSLWCAAFPSDSREYVRGFLTDLPSETVTLIGECDNRIATMLFLLPGNAVFRGRSYSVRYLYAGCTHPEFRGHGYYRQLMVAAAQKVEEMGEHAIFLHPADDVLTATYKRLGYRSGIYGSERSCCQHKMRVCDTIDNYLQLRDLSGKQIAERAVFWEFCTLITRRFVTDALAVGAKMNADADGVQLTHADRTLEYLCADTIHVNKDYCLWLPLGDTPLTGIMNEFDGLTGLVGD